MDRRRFIRSELLKMSINQKRFVSCLLDLIECKQQFERVMRILAAEVS